MNVSNRVSAVSDALVSAQISEEIPPQDRIYDKLIGSWRVRVVDEAGDGSRHENEGEWHFGYVLEGRAVQDVWIVPIRAKRTRETARLFNRYGSSVRFYEPTSGTWRVVWINPVSGALQTLVGRRVGDRIVQIGTDSDLSTMRWTFEDITDRSFHWIGERSTDGGKTWHIGTEFFATR